MIKISVMYPNAPAAHFDNTYYRDIHMPMVKQLMGRYCKRYTIDKAVDAGVSSSDLPYIAMGHLYCESLEDFQAGFGPHREQILGDIPNYTNLTPVMQFSEVLVG